MATIETAIKAINSSAVFSSTPADNYDGLTWQEGTTPIDKATVEAKKVELQAAEDAAAATDAVTATAGGAGSQQCRPYTYESRRESG